MVHRMFGILALSADPWLQWRQGPSAFPLRPRGPAEGSRRL